MVMHIKQESQDEWYSDQRREKVNLAIALLALRPVRLHRLYVGKYRTASIQFPIWALIGILALFRVVIIPAILVGLIGMWWMVDVMLIIMGKFTDRAGRKIEDWV